MIWLNVLYFLIISYYGYTFLKSEGRIVKSPFDKTQLIALTGPEMFWVFTFATGLLACAAPLPIDLKALRLFVIMILCCVGFGIVKEKPIWSLPLKLYFLYLVWLIIGLIYSPSVFYGIRVILKYSYPLIFCLFASSAIDNFTTAIKASLAARWIGLIAIIFAFVPFIGYFLYGLFWYSTAQAIHFISLMTLSIALFFFTNEKKKNLFFSVLFLLPCFLWVFRTSIMGSGIAIMAFALIKWRIKALPLIVCIIVAGVVAVFTIPSLKQKMFKSGSENMTIENFQQGGVSMDNVETNAREAMWNFLENKFYKDHKIIGSGTGAVQNYMYSHFIFGGLTVPHSDFVQMKCDNGLIGLILYCTISILIFLHCFKIYWTTDDNRIKLFAITAGASMLGVFATMYSDNTVNYSMATLAMPYGFYGMTLGLKRAFDNEKISQNSLIGSQDNLV